MTYNPIDRDEILARARPWYVWEFAHTQPDTVTTTSSGGGSVSFGDNGAVVNAGSTTDDRASLQVVDPRSFTSAFGRIILELWFRPSGTPYTNDATVGWGPSNPLSTDDVQRIDLANEEYRVGTNTQAWAGSIGDNEISYLRVENDRWANETTFELRTNNFTETHTFNVDDNMDPHIVATESNGASGETVNVYAGKLAVEFEE